MHAELTFHGGMIMLGSAKDYHHQRVAAASESRAKGVAERAISRRPRASHEDIPGYHQK